MPEGLNALRKAPKCSEEYLPPILPFIRLRDILIVLAWICYFHCIEHCWQLFIPLLPVPIYHLPGPLIRSPCLTMLYVILKIFLAMSIIVLTFKFSRSFKVVYNALAMRVEVNCWCFYCRSVWAQVCGPTILVILNFPVAFCLRAQTLQLQSDISHTTV